MNYSSKSTNGQRLDIAAYGYQEVVSVDSDLVREAIRLNAIPRDASPTRDAAKNTLRFAVFLKAARVANLKPHHILIWLANTWSGREAIAAFAQNELNMVHGRKPY